MLKLLPNSESVKIFLRHHVLRASTEKNKLHCLQDCLEEPKPGRSKTWLSLIIPVIYTLYILMVKVIMKTRAPVGFTDTNGTVRESGSIDHRYLGRQLAAPVITTTKEDIQLEWENYQDLIYQAYLLRIKMLKNERMNKFTPKPVLEFTEIPITTTKIDDEDNLPVCKRQHSSTDNTELDPGGSVLELITSTLQLSLYPFLKGNSTLTTWSFEEMYPMVDQGGHYRPEDCWSRHKVAILVPYRSRLDHLMTFLLNIHPFLMAQKLEYRIFVVEQHGKNKFNKGRLLNAGFKVIQKLGYWPCVILHDVDLLPLSSRILYSCSTYPRLMSSALYFINGSYNNISDDAIRFGGVAALTLKQYERVNGHSNLYRGWGNEDLDMYIRLRAAGLRITTNNKNISRYVQLPHAQEFNQDVNWSLLFNAKHRYRYEGLSTLEYKVLNVTYHHLFTHILVVLDERSLNRISSIGSGRFNKYHLLSILNRPQTNQL